MSAAFKEWAVVCEAMGGGRQSIILRKGGIAEGKEGFAFQHGEFYLFPTWFHEQLSKTVLPETAPIPPQLEDEVEIRYAATLEWTRLVTDLDLLRGLRDFHVLHDSVVEERFQYDGCLGVHVALVRVFRLEPPRRLAMEKKFGGCRSWITIPDLDEGTLVSVISDEEHARRRKRLLEVLG